MTVRYDMYGTYDGYVTYQMLHMPCDITDMTFKISNL